MGDPPADAKVLIAKPLGFKLLVIKPSGEPIADAQVSIEWDFQNPYDEIDDVQVVQTDAVGVAIVPVLDPGQWLKSTEVTGSLSVSKRHHGPIVAEGETFKNGPASLRIKYEPAATPLLQVLDATPPKRVLWGRPRIVGRSRDTLEVILMEGGTLGKAHPTIRTRRLTSAGRPATPPTPLSEIDEELLFHIAHGDLAPTRSTDYRVVHDPDSGDFDPCVAGKCTATLPPLAPAKAKGIPKISARLAVVGGLRMAHVNAFEGTRIKLTGPGDPDNLNPRLMVGIVRLCRQLSLAAFGGLEIKTFITVGFGRAGEDRAHGNGRAVDFSGASTAHTAGLVDAKDDTNTNPLDPNCSWPISGRFHVTQTIPCVAEQDFVVLFHWGLVQRLVQTATGAVVRRPFNDKGTYDDAFRSTRSAEKLLYALSVLPTEAERGRGHTLNDAHYTKAGVLFRGVYNFFSHELSMRDTDLGPLPAAPAPPAIPSPQLTKQLADDTATRDFDPGEVGGQTLHPDTPDPDLFVDGKLKLNAKGKSELPRRHSHVDHIHANVGPMGDGTFFER